MGWEGCVNDERERERESDVHVRVSVISQMYAVSTDVVIVVQLSSSAHAYTHDETPNSITQQTRLDASITRYIRHPKLGHHSFTHTHTHKNT
jgi:hypothetical protein